MRAVVAAVFFGMCVVHLSILFANEIIVVVILCVHTIVYIYMCVDADCCRTREPYTYCIAVFLALQLCVCSGVTKYTFPGGAGHIIEHIHWDIESKANGRRNHFSACFVRVEELWIRIIPEHNVDILKYAYNAQLFN